ncbi:MAG TPA: serine/threonine-protein kinase, partial [Caldimonas sp.]|nr:serine/threonine-protein kinase [Caldimonas sp.]
MNLDVAGPSPMTLAAAPSPAPAGRLDDSRLLPAGTRLDEFEILRPLGVGGFGIVYLALDRSLLRQVALKEFMPAELASRAADGTVGPRSPDRAEQFERSLDAFFNEARLLAPFNHPALVRVHRFWKANGTAYMAMQYCPGMTLVEARRAMHAPPDEAWLRAVVAPVLDALERLHRAGVFHRDISPDNILLLPSGRPILLDFGSARRVVGPGTKSLTAVLKPNFAPVEQYGDAAGMAQGPWTDLYALGATVQFLLTGEAPTPAVLRVVDDARAPLASAGDSAFPGVSKRFLAAIDWTAAVAPKDRPQSVQALREALGDDPPLAPAATAAPRAQRFGRRALVELALAASAVLGVAAWALVSTTSTSAAGSAADAGAAVSAPLLVTAPASTAALPTPATAATATMPAVPVVPVVPATPASAPAAPAAASAAPETTQAMAPAAKPAPSPAPRSAPVKRPAAATASVAPAMPTSPRPAPIDAAPRSPAEACAGRNFIARM